MVFDTDSQPDSIYYSIFNAFFLEQNPANFRANPRYRKWQTITTDIIFNNNEWHKLYKHRNDIYYNISYDLSNGFNSNIIIFYVKIAGFKYVIIFDKMTKIISFKTFEYSVFQKTPETSRRREAEYKRLTFTYNNIRHFYSYHHIRYFKYNNTHHKIDTLNNNRLVVDHIDGNTRNNNPQNLQIINNHYNSMKGRRL